MLWSSRTTMTAPFLTIGIVGGMSPESTVTYYEGLVARGHERVGPNQYPRIVIASVNFDPYVHWQHEGNWEAIASGLAGELQSLAAAGCDFAAIATNTMHKILPMIQPALPVLSIMDAVADVAQQRGIARLGLTGTGFTMSDGFYEQGLQKRGVACVVPEQDDQDSIHSIIYEELIRGDVKAESVTRYAAACRRLVERGADAVLLGCTELGMLAAHEEWPADLAYLDSTPTHIEAIFQRSLRNAIRPPQQGRSSDLPEGLLHNRIATTAHCDLPADIG